MQIQLEFRSRDILKQACQLRLTGTKDLLQHFVQNNATNYTHDMHRDDIWEMMAEITLTPSTVSYEARQDFERSLCLKEGEAIQGVRAYLAAGDFSKAVSTLIALHKQYTRLTELAQVLDSISLLHCIQQVADRLRLTVVWPTEQLEQQYVWAIENDSSAIEMLRHQSRFSDNCSSGVASCVRKLAREAGFSAPRSTEMKYIVSEVNQRVLGRKTGLRYGSTMTGRLPSPEVPEIQNLPKPTEKEEIMSTKPVVPFETVHFVYGTDVTTMSEDQLIDAIKQVENEIAKLDVVKTKSKKIDTRKNELGEMLAKIVETLDAR